MPAPGDDPISSFEKIAGGYDAMPYYAPDSGSIAQGWAAGAAELPTQLRCLGVDGPACLDWDAVEDAVSAVLRSRLGTPVRIVRTDAFTKPTAEVLELTDSPRLRGDRHFATLAAGSLSELFDVEALRRSTDSDGPVLVLGCGAALVEPETLWWVDLPKRYAEATIAAGAGRHLALSAPVETSLRRLFYIDWPLLDRHRDAQVGAVARWFDVQDVHSPTSIAGSVLRSTCAELARRPFRTRPTFNSTSWGGHWAQQELGHNKQATNTALGYELIAPESGVLLGADADICVEIPFQLVVALAPKEVMGSAVHAEFGLSFPIRFDYLDTVDGGNLSVHCHPQPDYMREVFGWPYAQHESYYLMRTSPGSQVFLGLQEDASISEFEHAAHQADAHQNPFDITRYVQAMPADAHQLLLIPAGTPHGSGAGNVVLEVSATPYLYSLRFYDWLRRDRRDEQRAVHVEHAFLNLDSARRGVHVTNSLIQQPATVADGTGWHDDLIGSLPDMFFEVTRVHLEPGATATMTDDDRFHVMTVVEGPGITIDGGAPPQRQQLSYAETAVVPAAVGDYRLHNFSDAPVWVVKAHVR